MHEDGSLAFTPVTTAKQDELRIRSDLQLSQDGKWQGKTAINASGAFNLELRSMVLGIDPQKDQFVKQHLRFGLQRGSGLLHKSDPYETK